MEAPFNGVPAKVTGASAGKLHIEFDGAQFELNAKGERAVIGERVVQSVLTARHT